MFIHSDLFFSLKIDTIIVEAIMFHLALRTTKPKNALGRGKSIVLYNTRLEATYAFLKSLAASTTNTGDEFGIEVNENGKITINTYNDPDYVQWQYLLTNTQIVYVLVPEDNLVTRKTTVPNAVVADRVDVEAQELVEERGPLIELYEIHVEAVHKQPRAAESQEVSTTPMVPMTEITEYGNEFDLPIVTPLSVTGWVGRMFSMFSGTKESKPVCRSPVVVYQSYLGGYIAVYKSTTSGNDVDIALFDIHPELVRVFSFQDGCPAKSGVNGFSNEDLINIAALRITHLNDFLPSDENVKAIVDLNSAFYHLHNRMLQRQGML